MSTSHCDQQDHRTLVPWHTHRRFHHLPAAHVPGVASPCPCFLHDSPQASPTSLPFTSPSDLQASGPPPSISMAVNARPEMGEITEVPSTQTSVLYHLGAPAKTGQPNPTPDLLDLNWHFNVIPGDLWAH